MTGLFELPDYGQQEQLLALGPVAREVEAEFDLPVARVQLDLPQPHMDRLFDYSIPKKMADVPVGARVNVEIAGRRVDGFVAERVATTQVPALRPIRRVISMQPVLTPEVRELARRVAKRQACPVADALRLAIPQRHARAEKEFEELPEPVAEEIQQISGAVWDGYAGGPEYMAQLGAGRHPRVAVQLRARDRVASLLAPVLAEVRGQGQGAIVVVPTPVMARELAAEITELTGMRCAVMVAQDDHATRYRTFLSVLHGRSQLVIGTRSAAWAPVQNLGMVCVVDDHHSALAEPRSPYIHARDLLAMRAREAGFLAFNYGPSPELANMVQAGFAKWITPIRAELRSGVAQVLAASDFRAEGVELARMPSALFSVVREGLERGPVLITVPRAGYIPLLACNNCREVATCPVCGGRLEITQPGAPPRCSRCSLVVYNFRCWNCNGTQLRAVRIGSQRTAQEIGRAFRGVPIYLAGAGKEGPGESARIVIATPGAAPAVRGGYAAGVVLDAGFMLRSQRLDAEVYFLRTLAHCAAYVTARSNGGKLLVVGDVPQRLMAVAQAWDMAGFASGTLEERRALSLPPAACWVELLGPAESLREYLGLLRVEAAAAGYEPEEVPLDALLAGGAHDLVPGMAVLGPQEEPEGVRAYLRYGAAQREEKTAIVYRALKQASAKRMARGLRVKVAPQL